MPLKRFVTARNTITNQQIFIETKNPKEALGIARELHKIELKEYTYRNISLRSSVPSLKKYIDMTQYFLNGA